MLLVIDNYDSFVHNLARYFQQLGQETLVARNDALDVARVRELKPAAIILSPGPCAPEQAGESLAIVRALYREVPIFGVCLGHQTIGAALGANIVRAPAPMHGRSSEAYHQGHAMFRDVPSPFTAGRYHSLVIEERSLPDELEVTARTADGVIMAVAHRTYPVFGVQFHPESVLTPVGYQLLANFLRQIGLPAELPRAATPARPALVEELPAPPHPLTF